MNEKVKEILSYVIIVAVVLLIRTFLATPIKVNGSSMETTLSDGNYMILKKYDKEFERFDIVVVNHEGNKLIKRIIGLPKEDIEYKDNELYIDGKKIKEKYGYGNTNDFVDYCGKNEYYVLGDNREDSTDSRIIGCVSKEDILGTTNFVILPFSKWGKVE